MGYTSELMSFLYLPLDFFGFGFWTFLTLGFGAGFAILFVGFVFGTDGLGFGFVCFGCIFGFCFAGAFLTTLGFGLLVLIAKM